MRVHNAVILRLALLLLVILFGVITVSSVSASQTTTVMSLAPTSTPTSTPTPPHCVPKGSIVASPNQPNTGYSRLYDIDAIAPNDVWAVGVYWSEITHKEDALIEHWDGVIWSIMPGAGISTHGNFLFSVDAVAANDVWAVGQMCPEKSRCRTLTEHWNGITWSVIASPNIGTLNNLLTAVSAVASNDVWATGSNTIITNEGPVRTFILHWNGTAWSIVPNPSIGTENNGFNDIEAISTNDVWAVGWYIGPDTKAGEGNWKSYGMFQHWDGTSWSFVSSPASEFGVELKGMTAVAANDMWAVGLYSVLGRNWPIIEHWDGTAWSVIQGPETNGTYDWLIEVDAISSDNVWAVGFHDLGASTLVEHWNGATWTIATSPNAGSDSALYSVATLPSGEVWVAGGYSDGTGKTLIEEFRNCILVLPVCPSEKFTDVCPTDYFYKYVQRLTDDAILSGYNSSPPCLNKYWVPCFNPASGSTRGQISKVVSLAAGFSEPVILQSFEDVPPGHTFYAFVQRMAERGIISGYVCGGPGEPCVPPANRPYLRPGNMVTRGQLAKMVATAFGWSEPAAGQQFQDVPTGSTFYPEITRLAGRHIINGYACGGDGEPCGSGNLPYFRPGNYVTRGQTSKIVQLAREEPTSTPTPLSATATSTRTQR